MADPDSYKITLPDAALWIRIQPSNPDPTILEYGIPSIYCTENR